MKKQLTHSACFPLHYFPPIPWFVAALRYERVYVDADQPYRKQRYHSRAFIKMPNRVLPLTIPVARRSARAPLRDKMVSFAEDWPGQHWRSLQMAYRRSPYYEYYEDRLRPLFEEPAPSLVAHNWRCLRLVAELLNLPQVMEEGAGPAGLDDFRGAFDPSLRQLPPWFEPVPYAQVFPPFAAGLSILDLLFNLGPESLIYLRDAWLGSGVADEEA
ncbi:MAG: hypothetical protein D6722_20330 [Bacteroidetes bacterium]|nr:MAG: hypothetical protein D6722_20330 [Bacteroidota bacterium]